ncbi:SRPBCC domain-containing protein [Streptomyces sp. OUCMDZ-4982]|uniref:SRPBCC domain-containing protein n=1 Tax=Streptomyces sp. OUCMDZ-4982 TaxID=2973090 RepID=UPI00215C38B3|nr:SRPBCC domain-containing protein [Streptomyces sp. OUCMDZ-4982]MCR8946315.1 SRPBCC domain-containing protein [Streptomyces sp. OUCMDZ-4982]
MEHQVFVPVPVPALRRTLGDPARVARCVPGIQQDADGSASPLAGRLKFRAGGHTITYRGELKLSGPGAAEGAGGDRFTVTGEGVEARGAGAVKLALTVSLTATDGGTTLTYGGTASGDGRLAELEEGAALAAAQRLLDRFTQQLVTETLAVREGEDPAPGSAEDVSAEGLAGDVEPPADGREGEGAGAGTGSAAEPGSAAGADEPAEPAESGSGSGSDAGTGSAAGAAETSEPGESAGASGALGVPEPGKPVESSAADEATGTPEGADLPGAAAPGEPAEAGESASVFDSPVPPPSLDPVAGVEFTVPDEPPAEAAHARRTMIGRSAEEVDHAPPRGRYAPVPSPDAGGASTTLRWVAPAAALALASAVVLSRALRRRR